MDVISRNNVTVQGPEGAPTIMLAHGLGCDQRFWRLLVSQILDHYRVVLFDYVGSGNSLRQAYSLEHYSDLNGYRNDLLDVRRALGLEGVHLVGHSISSMIGMLAVLKEPQFFHSLSMVAPSPRFLNDPSTGYVGGFEKSDIDEYLEVMDRNFIGWATAFAQLAAGSDNQAERELFESFCSTDLRTIKTFAQLSLYVDQRQKLKDIPIRTKVLQCRRDPLAPLSVGHFLRRQIPLVDYVELDEAGHCPHVTHPVEVARELDAFWRN